jgi:hypothetical protein
VYLKPLLPHQSQQFKQVAAQEWLAAFDNDPAGF